MTEFIVKSAALTSPGEVRKKNDDYVALYEPHQPGLLKEAGRLYVAADGVGGLRRSEQASRYAVRSMLHRYFAAPQPHPGRHLRSIARQVGNEIHNHSGDMATTMVAAVIRGKFLSVMNIGDSRAYLIRDGHAEQITIDHAIPGEVYFAHDAEKSLAARNAGQHLITRSLGAERDSLIDIFEEVALQPGDRVLLCTDGLTRYARPQDLVYLTAGVSPEEAARNCLTFAVNQGGVDNIGVVVAAVLRRADSIQEAAAHHPRRRLPPPAAWRPLSRVANAILPEAHDQIFAGLMTLAVVTGLMALILILLLILR